MTAQRVSVAKLARLTRPLSLLRAFTRRESRGRKAMEGAVWYHGFVTHFFSTWLHLIVRYTFCKQYEHHRRLQV